MVPTLAVATASMDFFAIPTRFVAVVNGGCTYAFGRFPIALEYGLAR
jgi:hypothetical protein